MKLSSLDVLYEKADNKDKRKIIGSIYLEKLVFDRFHYRTARLHEAVDLIYNLGECFSENENGQTESNFDLSTLLPRTGFLLSWDLISYKFCVSILGREIKHLLKECV